MLCLSINKFLTIFFKQRKFTRCILYIYICSMNDIRTNGTLGKIYAGCNNLIFHIQKCLCVYQIFNA